MLLEVLRADVARYAKKMAESRLVRASQGNLSARPGERADLHHAERT